MLSFKGENCKLEINKLFAYCYEPSTCKNIPHRQSNLGESQQCQPLEHIGWYRWLCLLQGECQQFQIFPKNKIAPDILFNMIIRFSLVVQYYWLSPSGSIFGVGIALHLEESNEIVSAHLSSKTCQSCLELVFIQDLEANKL